MDVHDDIIIVAPQFGWGNAVHRDIIFPMLLGEHIDFPKSKEIQKLIFSLIYTIIYTSPIAID